MAATVSQFATDPAAFQEAITIPSAHGPRRFGDVMADFQRERFALINPALIAVANGTKPEIGRFWWEATKGASKDSDLAVCMLWLLAFSRRASLLCQVGAADADQAGELRKAAKDILALNPWLADRVRVDDWKLKCGATNSLCEIIPADVIGSQGARPALLILNEISCVKKREFAENLMDNAAKVPNGLVVIATNAGHIDTWQFKWRELARTSNRWVFDKRSTPAPWIDDAEILEARRRNTAERYARLWNGTWSAGGGGTIDADDLERAVCLSGPQETFDVRISPYLGSLDLGVRRDHSAFVIFALNLAGDRLRVANCWSWDPKVYGGRVPLGVVQRHCLRVAQDFRLLGIVYDPHQGELLAEQLAAKGVAMFNEAWTVKSKEAMALALLEAFREPRQIDLYRDKDLIRDLSRIKITERANRYTMDAPRDEFGHADRGMAFAMGFPWAIDSRRDYLRDHSQEYYSQLLHQQLQSVS